MNEDQAERYAQTLPMIDDEEFKKFFQTAKQICDMESELIRIHEKRIAAIRKMRVAAKRGDKAKVAGHLNNWLVMWNDVMNKITDITRTAQAGAKRHDGVLDSEGEAGVGPGREQGSGDAVARGRAEAPTKPEA
jgi:hypothetical protein